MREIAGDDYTAMVSHPDPVEGRPVDIAPSGQLEGFPPPDANQRARVMMLQLDPLLRKLPYEQRTALLLNLLVTYACEQPAAVEARGKFINAMTEEFRNRLQMFLPLKG